jgi:hypothetical protein
MSRVTYVPNPLFEEEVQVQPQHQRGMRRITEVVAEAVRMLAPHKTGYYERRVRAVGTKIRTLDVFWHLVEYGSKNSPAYAPLRRGIRAAGLHFRPRPKP